MEMERSIPRSINFQDVLPVAVPAVARRKRFFPQGGASGFSRQGTSEIRIELGSVNSLLDPQHSYLEFLVENNSPGATVGFDIGGGHVFFEEVRVEQAGRVLARETAHNRLHAGILSMAQNSYDGQLCESITQNQRGLNDPGGGAANKVLPMPQAVGVEADNYANQIHNDELDIPVGGQTRVTMAMPTGLFTQDKLIPLPLVSQNNPLTLVLVLCDPQDTGAWTGPIAQNALLFQRVNYVAQLIEVGGDVIQQMRMMQQMGGGQLTISGQDIEHSTDVIPANTAGEVPIRIPTRKRSIKSLLFQINSEDFTQGAGVGKERLFNLSYGGNANMDSFQMKVGSVVYPPTAIQCWGNVARAAGAALPLPNQERGECAMELAKALGTLGFTNPTGRLSTIVYGTHTEFAIGAGAPVLTDGDNGDGAQTLCPGGNQDQTVTPFGIDLDSFQQTAIEGGLDSETMAMETTLICNINTVTSGIEDKNVHCYLIYDQHYYFNMDGTITFSN